MGRVGLVVGAGAAATTSRMRACTASRCRRRVSGMLTVVRAPIVRRRAARVAGGPGPGRPGLRIARARLGFLGVGAAGGAEAPDREVVQGGGESQVAGERLFERLEV